MAICEYLRLCTIYLTSIKFVLTQAIFRNDDDDDDDDNNDNSINFFIIYVLAKQT
jgi:hypothetical protein